MSKKVGIVGVGNVGASLAFSLAIKGTCKQIVLKDLRENVVQAMALDIAQAASVSNSKTLISVEKEDFKNCDVIVITAGLPRKPGMSRDDLLLTNAKIMKSVFEDIQEDNPNAIYIIVSNPLDAMVYTALKVSKLPKNRILGMAGILDSARMEYFIREKLGYGEGEIDAKVMGGHGDDMVPLPSYTTVQGKKLTEILSKEEIDQIVEKTKHGGAQIVKLLGNGSAYYAPAFSTSLMVEAILNDSKKVYPSAVLLEGEYGYKDIVAGVLVKIGKNGAEEILELEINEQRQKEFAHSVSSVKELVETLNSKFFV